VTKRTVLISITALGSLCLSGCMIALVPVMMPSTKGKTSTAIMDLKPLNQAEQKASVKMIFLETQDSKLQDIGGNVGFMVSAAKFNEKDQAVLDESLRGTIARLNGPKASGLKPEIRVRAVVHKYLMVITGREPAVMACVGWAAMDETDHIRFQEQFYAATTGSAFGTIGGAKNAVNRNIIRRIGEKSAALAGLTLAASSDSNKGTFDTYADAYQAGPKWPSVDWGWAAAPAQMDWERMLQREAHQTAVPPAPQKTAESDKILRSASVSLGDQTCTIAGGNAEQTFTARELVTGSAESLNLTKSEDQKTFVARYRKERSAHPELKKLTISCPGIKGF
jgi:hypothetical protein